MRTVLSVFLLLALIAPASAFERFWETPEARPVYHVQKHYRRHYRRHHYRRSAPREVVRTVVITTEPIGIGAQCVDQRVDVISTPHQTVEAAKDAAQTQWRAKAQFLAGGIYMDPRWSEDQKWLCSITDPRDSASSKVSETTGKLLGNSGELYRCYFSARPCRSNMQFGDE
jgi:hypothetical protein